jgi:predicted solute-binding protein
VFNPSLAWMEDCGLPFVFAVWIVRPGVELANAHVLAFTRARARGLAQLDAITEEACRTLQIPLASCRKYLRDECRFDVGAQLAPSLHAFRDAAAALGLCRGDLDPLPICAADACPS